MTGAVIVLWVASLWAVYATTRAKWYALGVYSGELSGRSVVVRDLCQLAQDGPAPEPVVWSHGVKADIVELSDADDRLTLYCR